MLKRLVLVASMAFLASGAALAQDLPAPGAAYATARQALLAQGYQPMTFPRGGEVDSCGRASVCNAYPEVIVCSGTGVGFCRFAFRAPDGGYLIGTTSGERLEDLRLELIGPATSWDAQAIERALAGSTW